MARIPLDTGPAKGVRTTNDPYDGSGSLFIEAWNHYIPDPKGTSGMYARRGFSCLFKNDPLTGKGQGVFCYRTIDGDVHNLIVSGGRIYRLDSTLVNRTDVTPTRQQYQLWFTGGTGTQPSPGDILEGITSGASAAVISVHITYGDFPGGNAEGYYLIEPPAIPFEDGEVLEVSSVTVGTSTSDSVDATIQIDPNSVRVYFKAGIDGLIITDESNRPWKVLDITQTPINGVPIDIDGKGTPWVAKGAPTVYAGSLFFITKTYNSEAAQGTIVWTKPGQFEVGYIQPGNAFRWTLEQTNGAPLYAIWGTETGLYYFRDQSIGMLNGIPGPSFEGNHTSDIGGGDNIGCTQSATIQQYSDTIFFCDSKGRPFLMPIGGRPVDIWLQMRQVVDENSRASKSSEIVSISCIEPTLQLYLCATFSSAPTVDAPPVVAYAFDIKTGTYVGPWNISTGAQIQAMGVLNDRFGDGVLSIIGDAPPVDKIVAVLGTEDGRPLATEDGRMLGLYDPTIGRTGVMWTMNAEKSLGFLLTTQDGYVITTQDDYALATQDASPAWTDDGSVPKLTVVTDRLGYAEDHVINVDSVTLIGQSTNQQNVSMETSGVVNTYESSDTPLPSADGTYRFLYGAYKMSGRGVTVTIDPITAETRHIIDRVSVKAVVSKAGKYDP